MAWWAKGAAARPAAAAILRASALAGTPPSANQGRLLDHLVHRLAMLEIEGNHLVDQRQ